MHVFVIYLSCIVVEYKQFKKFLQMTFFLLADNACIMVLGATNRPSELDAAILRRFAQNFEVGMPNQRERAKILNVILKGERVDDVDVDYIASLCDGFTGSDILELCKQAAYFSVRDFLQNELVRLYHIPCAAFFFS